MKREKAMIQRKIEMLEEKLEKLNPFDSPETIRFLMDKLDAQGCLLARILIEEEFERMERDFEG